jgi:hypothetical protein
MIRYPIKDLTLHVKTRPFLLLKAGIKKEEYRLCTPYWNNRFSDDKLPFRNVIIHLGYPALGEQGRTLVFPFRGIIQKEIQDSFFGDAPVWVHVIRTELSKQEQP